MFERDTHSTTIFHERLLFECTYGLVSSSLWVGAQNTEHVSNLNGPNSLATSWTSSLVYAQFERSVHLDSLTLRIYMIDLWKLLTFGGLFNGVDDTRT